jgi:hypothetical protein
MRGRERWSERDGDFNNGDTAGRWIYYAHA